MPTGSAANKQKFDPSVILKDKKNFPDDIEITLPNGAVMSLGDLREYDSATAGSIQTELEKGRAELARQKAALDAETNRVAQVYVQVENDKAAIEQAKKQLKLDNPRASKSEIEEMLEADPVYAALTKKNSELEGKIDNLTKLFEDKVKTITGTMNDVGQTYLTERYEREFQELMEKDDPARPKDLDLATLYKFANDNGIKKRNGIIDLPKAYKQMTDGTRRKLDIDAAYERGKTEATKERERAALQPKPGFAPEIPGLDNILKGKATPKTLNEAFAAAAHDPTMFGGGAAS